MVPPSRTPLWTPVETLAELDVTVTSPASNGPRIEVIDKRLWLELVSLPAAEAAALGTVLIQRARQAGWDDPTS